MKPVASSSRGGMQQASLNHTLVAGGSSSGSPLNPHLSTSEEEQHARALLELSIALIESALDILSTASHPITDAQLTQPSELMPGGTIGKHFRHVIETFQAFLLPLVARPPAVGHAVVMNYDAILPASRKPLARNVGACRRALAKIRDDLRTWGERAGDSVAAEKTGAAGVSGEVGTKGLAGEMRREVKLVAITPTRQEMRSSVGREVRRFPLLWKMSSRTSCGSARCMPYIISPCFGLLRYMRWASTCPWNLALPHRHCCKSPPALCFSIC